MAFLSGLSHRTLNIGNNPGILWISSSITRPSSDSNVTMGDNVRAATSAGSSRSNTLTFRFSAINLEIVVFPHSLGPSIAVTGVLFRVSFMNENKEILGKVDEKVSYGGFA